jgi:hypothetical protein
VKSITNGCKITKSEGRNYDLFVPTSVKRSETTKICDTLKKHFDQVIVSPKEDCEREDSTSCIKGLEIAAIRSRNSEEQEFTDMGMLLDIISPIGRKVRPMLINSLDITNS